MSFNTILNYINSRVLISLFLFSFCSYSQYSKPIESKTIVPETKTPTSNIPKANTSTGEIIEEPNEANVPEARTGEANIPQTRENEDVVPEMDESEANTSEAR